MGQKAGKKWTAEAVSQPTIPKSDRLLAWTRQRHPQRYAQLHAWLVAERTPDLRRGSPHDTLAWVRLAERANALLHGSIFAGAAALWGAGRDAER